MICFDFKKKKECEEPTVVQALKRIKYIVSPYLGLDADITDCTIISFGREPNFQVAYPPSALGKVKFEDVEFLPECEKWRGKINIGLGVKKRNFSIQNQVLYIAKCW
tara:strand:+ start:1633 stop:1953 length:321 start_codon:yes stop_codon:yes gene_type:complete